VNIRQRAVKWLGITLGGYVLVVLLFESFAVYMGHSDLQGGRATEDGWLLLTTFTGDGPQTARYQTVVGAVTVDGALYVAANHWPRQWYQRALASPDVEASYRGATGTYRAVPLSGAELERVRAAYPFPLIARILTGFPPRRFLRLEPA
jgi:hypothetical protein